MCESTYFWLKGGKELDEGMKFLSCIIILNEVWEITNLAWWKLLVKMNLEKSTTLAGIISWNYLEFFIRVCTWQTLNGILTWRFLTLEVAHEFNVLLDVMKALELSVITDDLHWFLNHLIEELLNYKWPLGVWSIIMMYNRSHHRGIPAACQLPTRHRTQWSHHRQRHRCCPPPAGLQQTSIWL